MIVINITDHSKGKVLAATAIIFLLNKSHLNEFIKLLPYKFII